MENKNVWHFNDDDFMKYAQDYVSSSINGFNYKTYIIPHSEMRELLKRTIEEFQHLEACIKDLITIAVDNKLYVGKAEFNFDNYVPASKIIKSLSNNLIEEKIANQLIKLMKCLIILFTNIILMKKNKKLKKTFLCFCL